MMRTMIALGAFLLVAGCAGEPTRERERMDAALQQLDADASYAQTANCLPAYQYDTTEVLDERHLLFKGNRPDDVWLNKLRHRCPGLREDDTLAFEMRGNRLCSLDTTTVVDQFLFWQRTGPTCSLGKFQKLTEAQASLIREAM